MFRVNCFQHLIRILPLTLGKFKIGPNLNLILGTNSVWGNLWCPDMKLKKGLLTNLFLLWPNVSPKVCVKSPLFFPVPRG